MSGIAFSLCEIADHVAWDTVAEKFCDWLYPVAEGAEGTSHAEAIPAHPHRKPLHHFQVSSYGDSAGVSSNSPIPQPLWSGEFQATYTTVVLYGVNMTIGTMPLPVPAGNSTNATTASSTPVDYSVSWVIIGNTTVQNSFIQQVQQVNRTSADVSNSVNQGLEIVGGSGMLSNCSAEGVLYEYNYTATSGSTSVPDCNAFSGTACSVPYDFLNSWLSALNFTNVWNFGGYARCPNYAAIGLSLPWFVQDPSATTCNQWIATSFPIPNFNPNASLPRNTTVLILYEDSSTRHPIRVDRVVNDIIITSTIFTSFVSYPDGVMYGSPYSPAGFAWHWTVSNYCPNPIFPTGPLNNYTGPYLYNASYFESLSSSSASTSTASTVSPTATSVPTSTPVTSTAAGTASATNDQTTMITGATSTQGTSSQHSTAAGSDTQIGGVISTLPSIWLAFVLCILVELGVLLM